MHYIMKYLLGILAVALPLSALADEVVIPLSINSPDFPSTLETTEFSIDLPLESVTQVALRIEGMYQEVIYVDVSNPWITGTRPAYLNLYLGDNGDSGWIVTDQHQFPAGEGSFDLEISMLTRELEDWSFLLDGVGQIGLECGPSVIHSSDGRIASAVSSWGTLNSVELILTYDPSVSVHEKNWGSVKSLFR